MSCIFPVTSMAVTLFVLGFPSCSSGGGGAGDLPKPDGNAQLERIEYGRLVDVYGLERTDSGLIFARHASDVLIGANIEDGRDTGSLEADERVDYDFVGVDPNTLQPRLFIPREIGTDAFATLLDRADDALTEVVQRRADRADPSRPFSVVPRNAAIRLSFSRPLLVDDDFFVARDEQGRVSGIVNNEAVQLLEVVGDPQGDPAQAFRPIGTRVIVRDTQLILDPVMLGTEGEQYGVRNNASGLPESSNPQGANVRVALALDGLLAIPGLRVDDGELQVGQNNRGDRSIVADFRSGNRGDDSSEFAGGFLRDSLPPRIVGDLTFFLEAVVNVNATTQEVTVFKAGLEHEIDRGDVLQFVAPGLLDSPLTAEVVSDPDDDRGNPEVQHVAVRIRRVEGLAELDPAQRPDYPSDRSSREEWLVRNAPRAVLSAEFTASRRDPDTGRVVRDDPRNFLRFAPGPLPLASGLGGELNERISPYASAVVRFTKPVDLRTVKTLETFYFATRDLTDSRARNDFIADRVLEAGAFNDAKYRTPHLVGSRRFDSDGSQTTIRLLPMKGFYFDETLRADPSAYPYFLHLIGGSQGVRDLSGNPLDFGDGDGTGGGKLVIPFTLDGRRTTGGQPLFANNRVAYVVRPFGHRDEDERPSYYRQDELARIGITPTPIAALEHADLFGSHAYDDGLLRSRPASRVRRVVDNNNQAPFPPQSSELRTCPLQLGGQTQAASNTAQLPFGSPVQTPFNPFGARLQTVWREIDMSLSRVAPEDFNLDVEQMFWAPFRGQELQFDEFDRMSLFLGHSEFRPEPCVGNQLVLPTMEDSGLGLEFARNYAFNPAAVDPQTEIEEQPAPHVAYVDRSLAIQPEAVVVEPTGENRFMPLPDFDRPYFVYRDERVEVQGGASGEGSDVGLSLAQPNEYIISPWLHGCGDSVADVPLIGGAEERTTVNRFWSNFDNFRLPALPPTPELATGGLLSTIALPLLADFQVHCDSAVLPHGRGYIASGVNGWQVAITVQSAPPPNFRVFSAGNTDFGASRPSRCIGPDSTEWSQASGTFARDSQGVVMPVIPGDNTMYWTMIDFARRLTVTTSGFIDIDNPHRIGPAFASLDPRLGPYFAPGERPPETVPDIDHQIEPPARELPAGTTVTAEFRGASAVDSAPWFFEEQLALRGAVGLAMQGCTRPTADNFPNDPRKAGDAHVRKFDSRRSPYNPSVSNRDFWTHFYNRTVTDYVEDAELLRDRIWLQQFVATSETFGPGDIAYFNWRFLMTNAMDSNPAVGPAIESFAVAYTFSDPQ